MNTPSGIQRDDATLERMQRRTLLQLGFVGASALALAGSGAALLSAPQWRNGQFAKSALEVVVAITAGLLEGSLPSDTQDRATAIAAQVERLVATVSRLPLSTQRELSELLAILALPPGRLALTGLSTDWASASAVQVEAALETMRTSAFTVRRQVYHALRDLTRATWYAAPAAWLELGYPGPRKLA